MELTEKNHMDPEPIKTLLKIWPPDTIHLVNPGSHISPSDNFAKQLKILNKLSPVYPIRNAEDAAKFDMELDLFVFKIMDSAINLTNAQKTKIAQKKTADCCVTCLKSLMSNSIYQYTNFDGLPLDVIYKKCKGDYHIFSIFLDLKINFANLSAYTYELLGAEYRVLNNPKLLEPRMELQFFANACVMSCRSTWDKLLGLIVLVESGKKKYNNYIGLTSKKKYIRKHLKELQENMRPACLEEFLAVIEKLDNTFRTQEAHGSGGNIRNTAFSVGSLSNTVLLEIIGHYNYLHEYLDNYWHDLTFLNEKNNFIDSCNTSEK